MTSVPDPETGATAAGPDPSIIGRRPATVSWDPGLPGIWLRDFRLGEWLGRPVSPLFESWALTRIERRVDESLAALMGIRLPADWQSHVVVNGWYYYGFNIMPASPLGLAGFLARHLLPSLVVRPRDAVMAIPPLSHFGIAAAEREWRERILPAYRGLVDRSRAAVESADGGQLVTLVDDLADAAGTYYTSVTKVAGFATKAEVPFATFYRVNVGPLVGGSHLDLLVGLGKEMRAAADHAIRSLDWIEPTVGETSEERDEAAERARRATARAQRSAAEAAARAALASDPRLLQRFNRLLADAQRYTIIREEQVADLSLAWPPMRRALARLGAILVQRGILESVGQIHFLVRAELEPALADGAGSLADAAEARRRTWLEQSRAAAPLRLGTMPRMFERLLAQTALAIRGASAGAEGSIVGIPASPGQASGPARIILDLADGGRVQVGDVLVCAVTTPAWTPLFGRVAAVVTDTGGVATHASVVAREYGLPAVVGTGDATTRLKDGEVVEVNGSSGVVRPVER
jgi:rifampicin phosphotransferase